MPFILGISLIIIVGIISGAYLLTEDIKKEIKYRLATRKKKPISVKDKNLNNLLIAVIVFLVSSIICGIIGYLLAKYTSSNIKKFIILGICCPAGYIIVNKVTELLYEYFEDLYNLLSLITFGIFALFCFVLKVIISAFVGIIALPILIIYFFIALIKISKD